MIDWNKHFDQIFVLHYAGYTQIEKHLYSELDRVGLTNSGILTVHNNISSPFLETLQKNIICDNVPNTMKSSSFSCSFGHYSIMKIAELKGYSRILILEDDIAFLNDVDEINHILDTAWSEVPNYDVCLFSHFQSPCTSDETHIPIYVLEMKNAAINGKMFIPFTSKSAAVASGSAYGLSRRGILCLRGLYEHQMQIADMVFRNIPYFKNGKIDGFHNEVLNMLKRYYCRYPIGLQNYVNTSVTSNILGNNFKSILAAQQKIAESVGIDYNKYSFS